MCVFVKAVDFWGGIERILRYMNIVIAIIMTPGKRGIYKITNRISNLKLYSQINSHISIYMRDSQTGYYYKLSSTSKLILHAVKPPILNLFPLR